MNIQDFITTETVVVRGRRNIEIARILTAMKALRLEVDHGLKMSRANVFQICKRHFYLRFSCVNRCYFLIESYIFLVNIIAFYTIRHQLSRVC